MRSVSCDLLMPINNCVSIICSVHVVGLVGHVVACKLPNCPFQVDAVGLPPEVSCTIDGALLWTEDFLVNLEVQCVGGLLPIVVVVVVVQLGVGVGCHTYKTK